MPVTRSDTSRPRWLWPAVISTGLALVIALWVRQQLQPPPAQQLAEQMIERMSFAGMSDPEQVAFEQSHWSFRATWTQTFEGNWDQLLEAIESHLPAGYSERTVGARSVVFGKSLPGDDLILTVEQFSQDSPRVRFEFRAMPH